MLIGEREARLLRKKFKEKRRDRVKQYKRGRWLYREERREERRHSISKIEQERHLSRFHKYLCPHEKKVSSSPSSLSHQTTKLYITAKIC